VQNVLKAIKALVYKSQTFLGFAAVRGATVGGT